MGDTRREQVLKTAADWTQALEQGDTALMAQVFTDDAIVWHNHDDVEMPISATLEVVPAIAGVATTSITVQHVSPTDEGFVQAYTATFSLKAGGEAVLRAIVLCQVDEDGRITRCDEWLDGAAMAPLGEALAAASA